MSDDDARQIREDAIRHDLRLTALEECMREQKPMLQAIVTDLGRLSSYNVEVAYSLKKAVFGNGTPGLLGEMMQIKERTTAREQAHNDDIRRIDRLLFWIGTTVVLTLLATVGFFLVRTFGGMP